MITFLHIKLNKAVATLNRFKAEKPHLDSQLEAAVALNQSNSVSTNEYQRILSRRNINNKHTIELVEDINLIKEKFNRSEIIAPFDGIVSENFIQLGEAIGSFEPIVRLFDNKNLVLHVEAPVELYHRIKIGMKVSATYTKVVFSSTVMTKYPVKNLNSRKFILRTWVDSEHVIGSSIRVNLPKKIVDDAYVIPFDAVIRAKQGYQVALLKMDSTVTIIDVKKLFHIEDDVAISSDELPDHCSVITEGNLFLSDGEQVSLL